jgi:hypothetical protein
MRLAGTLNHKSDPPRPSTLDSVGGWPQGGLVANGWAWSPRAVYSVADLRQHLAQSAEVSTIVLTSDAPAPANKQTARPRSLVSLSPLDAFRSADWADIWPSDWERCADRRTDGALAEAWRRPGATSDLSAVCWAEHCYVHSDAVGWLPVGAHTKGEVFAARHGVTLSELSRETLRQARSRVEAGTR